MKASVSEAVATAIRSVLHDTGRDAPSIDSTKLLSADLGLDSLDLAQTIVLLERSLGIDPFRTASVTRPVRSVGDLMAIYTEALGK